MTGNHKSCGLQFLPYSFGGKQQRSKYQKSEKIITQATKWFFREFLFLKIKEGEKKNKEMCALWKKYGRMTESNTISKNIHLDYRALNSVIICRIYF